MTGNVIWTASALNCFLYSTCICLTFNLELEHCLLFHQGIAQMNAFATSEDFFASGLDTPVSPAPGSATAPAFPVSFDSPATPPSAGFTATFPPVQVTLTALPSSKYCLLSQIVIII